MRRYVKARLHFERNSFIHSYDLVLCSLVFDQTGVSSPVHTSTPSPVCHGALEVSWQVPYPRTSQVKLSDWLFPRLSFSC